MQRRDFIMAGLAAAALPQGPPLPLSGFVTENGRLILSGARVGGSLASVALDTGAATSSASITLASRLSLPAAGSIAVNTAAGRMRNSWGRTTFELSGGVIRPQRVLFVPDHLQHGVDAVLAAAELGAIDLQFSSGELRQSDERPLPQRLDGDADILPITSLRSGDVVVRLLIDSGAALSSISEDGARRLARAPGAALLFYETPGGQQLRGLRLPRLVSGGAEFDDVILRVRVGLPPLRTRAGEIDGLLGVDAMRAFDWRFFVRRRQVSVSASGATGQTWIGAGVDFRSDTADPGRVMALAQHGPAERAGLKIGDRLIAMNGVVPTDDRRMTAVGTREGEVIEFEYERGSYRRTTSVVTAALL